MTKNDLLPCPLCGGHATEVWPDGRTYHYIKCDACGCRTATHVAAHGGSARDDWNCRAASADLSEFGVDGDWDAAAHIRLLRANGGPSSGYTADLIERLHAALAATEIASLRRELEEARAALRKCGRVFDLLIEPEKIGGSTVMAAFAMVTETRAAIRNLAGEKADG